MGESLTRTFTINNLGVADFAYTVRDEDRDVITAAPVLTSCGRADAFGYTCIDSQIAGGPVYHWVDISASGQNLGLAGANDYYGGLELPFAFEYYGTTYTELSISSYGQVYFEDRMADSNFVHQSIPLTVEQGGVQTFIAPYWASLEYPAADAPRVYYEVQGIAPHRQVVIQWSNVTANWANIITFQAILFEDSGNILMQYHTLDGDTGDNATIGIQGNEITGLEYGYNQPVLTDTLAICYVPPTSTNYACGLNVPDAGWLTETPVTGTVAANSATTVTVVFNTTSLTAGTYHAEIYLGGTDHTPYVIPVTLQVLQRIYLPIISRNN